MAGQLRATLFIFNRKHLNNVLVLKLGANLQCISMTPIAHQATKMPFFTLTQTEDKVEIKSTCFVHVFQKNIHVPPQLPIAFSPCVLTLSKYTQEHHTPKAQTKVPHP